MGPMVVLEGCRKSRPHRDSIPSDIVALSPK